MKILSVIDIILFLDFLRSLRKRLEKGNSKNGSKKNAAVVPATQQKPTDSQGKGYTIL